MLFNLRSINKINFKYRDLKANYSIIRNIWRAKVPRYDMLWSAYFELLDELTFM